MFSDGQNTSYNKVIKAQGNILTLAEELGDDAVDKGLLPTKVLTTCEFSLDVRYGDTVEVYDNLSFNVSAANFVEKKMAKSDLVNIKYIGTDDAIVSPFEQIAGKDKAVETMILSGGTNGSIDNISPADFIGEDRGAGMRTGIQAFLDNDSVSILAAPGITEPNVQLTLVAQCENLGSRFAVLDMPKDAKKVEDLINHRNIFDSNYAALYHPWLTVFDPLDRKNIAVPPSGSVVGIICENRYQQRCS